MLVIESITLEPGVVVGDHYRLECILGEGGMGTVWQAIDTTTGEARALKFLRRDRIGDARNETRLLREARALSSIAHDNVARVVEVSKLDDGTPFLVMERLEGETLKQRLARVEKMAPADAIQIAGHIAAAVSAAHESGIVHRDLKPDNVFLVGGGHVKVLDFGIAKDLRAAGDSLTTTGSMLGTLHYMAPEQVFGDDDVDDRADIWALGVLLYECVSGKKPTDGSGSGQVLKAIMTRSFPRLDIVAPECPHEVADLVESMLSRDRHQRPRMIEVVHALSGERRIPQRAGGRRRIGTIAAALAAITVGGFGAWRLVPRSGPAPSTAAPDVPATTAVMLPEPPPIADPHVEPVGTANVASPSPGPTLAAWKPRPAAPPVAAPPKDPAPPAPPASAAQPAASPSVEPPRMSPTRK